MLLCQKRNVDKESRMCNWIMAVNIAQKDGIRFALTRTLNLISSCQSGNESSICERFNRSVTTMYENKIVQNQTQNHQNATSSLDMVLLRIHIDCGTLKMKKLVLMLLSTKNQYSAVRIMSTFFIQGRKTMTTMMNVNKRNKIIMTKFGLHW